MLPLPAPQWITSAGKLLELERLCCLPQKNHIFFQCTVSFSSFVFLSFVLNGTAQMRPGDGVEELILTLLVSD